MLGLPSFSIWTKLAIVAAWSAFLVTMTTIKVSDYVTAKYETKALNEKIHFVEKVRTVAVLDSKAVQTAVEKERARNQRIIEDEQITNEILRAHENDAKPWCELSPDELRQWNGENSKLMGVVPDGVSSGGKELPNAGASSKRQASGAVAQQNGNP